MRRFVTAVLVAAVVVTISGIMLAGDVPNPAPAAQQQATDPLVRVLQAKGVLSAQEAQALAAVPLAEQRDQLTALLLKKGVISTSDLQGVSNSPNERLVGFSSSATYKPAVMVETVATAPAPQAPAPKPPAVIPAVAPTRVLQLGPAKVGGLIPAIKLGPVGLRPYGFFKSSIAYDSSSPYGNDFPLPGFIGGDSGPDKSPEFHVKARAFRIGSNFEWPDISKKVALTGKIEFDFEGDFTRVANRSVSAIRSSQPSLRLAWGRIDYNANDKTSVFALFGQDWTPFGSSILPNMVESTIYAVGFGNLYERVPQWRVGLFHKAGGSRSFAIAPEFAVVLPAFGTTPGNISTGATTCTPTTTAAGVVPATCFTAVPDVAEQLAYGERIGPDSAKPSIEGRLLFQFQADKAKGVAPAQIAFSGMHGTRGANVSRTFLNSLATAPFTGVLAANRTAILNAFRTGQTVEATRWGWSGGFSLPTRWVTLQANYYRGADLRWYFQGGLYPDYNVAAVLQPGTFGAVQTMDAGSSVLFGCALGTGVGTTACVPTFAPQHAVRAQGGFAELAFPLSRIAHANPEGRNAGWTMVVHYGIDAPFARDVRAANNNGNMNGTTGGRGISDLGLWNLQYKMNSFVTLAVEESYYRTRSFRGAGVAGTFPAFNGGLPSHQWHDFRSEFFSIFTF